jgi:hypothetical protein
LTKLTNSVLAMELTNVRKSLRSLDHSLRRLAPMLSAAMSMNGVSKGNGRIRPRLSPKGRASLVLQGRYMGYMRQLKPRQKAQVRKVKEVKGVRAAIRAAKDLAAVH